MPELPEVQTVVSNLAPKIKNKAILDYREFWHKVNYTQNNSALKKEINKLKIIDVDRKGKYIIINLKKILSCIPPKDDRLFTCIK